MKPETIAHKLQEVELRVLSPKVCQGGYGRSAINATSVVCAGRVGGGKDTCGVSKLIKKTGIVLPHCPYSVAILGLI